MKQTGKATQKRKDKETQKRKDKETQKRKDKETQKHRHSDTQTKILFSITALFIKHVLPCRHFHIFIFSFLTVFLLKARSFYLTK
jgi:hypothetical protein